MAKSYKRTQSTKVTKQ